MSKIKASESACCFNSLSDVVASINGEWKKRWGQENPGFCFRGTDIESYDLNPSLLRKPYPDIPSDLAKLENTLWVEFRLRSKPLLGHNVSGGWEALLTMQQYGFPTRLLDWSRSLAVATYFAIRDIEKHEDGAVWVMAARHLMELRGVMGSWRTVVGDPSIENLSLREDDKDLDKFMENTPVPVSPDQFVSRMIAQRGIYTLHSYEKDSLELLAMKDRDQHGDSCFLHKIVIPAHVKEGLRSEILLVAGITEETIFPDIEGFARDFVNEYKRKHPPT
mgnify:FL=1|tara:strand:+ start:125953 stop:126786 length:834 start_codon:yes stop_codon:yes gene_type:complete